MKILFIEPHPDDILLSCYHHIVRLKTEDHDIQLLSVANHPWINRSSDKFCSAMNISRVGMKYILDVDFATYKIPPKEIKAQPNPYTYQREKYLKTFSERLEETTDKLREVCTSVNPDLIITCLGIFHPMHVIVREAVDIATPNIKRQYYMDIPYKCKRYGEAIFNSSNHKSVSLIIPTIEEGQAKVDLFKTCYPTEAGLLRFDKETIINAPEEIMESNEVNM